MREREGRAARPGPVTTTTDDAAGAPSARRRPILVVDDDPQVLGLIVRGLRGRGHEVRAVSNGREALRTIYGGGPTPSLLLTDVDMPGMTGIELAARIAADRPGTAIVLMSGDPTQLERARERPELIRDVLPKPFSVADLVAVVEGIVGDPRADSPADRPAGAPGS